MPRALTEQEKCRLFKRLLEKGKDVVLTQGIKKVSVDDITKAANMAKGSFYQHFESKEKYMLALIMEIYQQIFALAEEKLLKEGDLKENVRNFLMNLFHFPEMVFLTKNYNEINELVENLSKHDIQSAEEMEADMYSKLLVVCGIDINRVKPGVVHNYVHSLYMIMGSDLMMKDDLPKTCELMIESLISYIFGGAE